MFYIVQAQMHYRICIFVKILIKIERKYRLFRTVGRANFCSMLFPTIIVLFVTDLLFLKRSQRKQNATRYLYFSHFICVLKKNPVAQMFARTELIDI